MRGVASRFFIAGVTFALIGMSWGIQMSASHDHTLSPAHGHLNLLGFVMMSIFGAYYCLTPKAARSPLAPVHFWLSLAAVICLVPGIVLAITGITEVLAKVGAVLTLAAMALFAFQVVRHGAGMAPAREETEVRDLRAAE